MPKKITEVEALSKGTGQENVLVVAGNSLKQIPWRSISRPDASADYAASGAASVQAWAAMAKEGSTAEYRVAAGRYQISSEGNAETDHVMIVDVPGGTARYALLGEFSDEFPYLTIFAISAPGAVPTEQLYLSVEENLLQIYGVNYLLPRRTEEDEGKILTVGAEGVPEWKTKPSYDADEIACQYYNAAGMARTDVGAALESIGDDLYDLIAAKPPHIVISLAFDDGVGTITGATQNGTAISLTNTSGTANYAALLAAINSAVLKGGNVELCLQSTIGPIYYQGVVSRAASSVLITYLDMADPTDIQNSLTFLRCSIEKDYAEAVWQEI